MAPPMSTNPLGSTVPAGAFSPHSPQSMWADGSRSKGMNEEQREEGHNDNEGEGKSGPFSCCFSPSRTPRTPNRPDMLKAEKRKEKAEKKHEAREKKLREKHEEIVREKHMERMRERH